MGLGSDFWIVGLFITTVLTACLVAALRRWDHLTERFNRLDESTPTSTVTETMASMERARYLTFTLALLALVPLNPAIFALILRHPRLHAILSIGAIAFILRNAWSLIAQLDGASLFPTKPTTPAILRNACIGLCLGFVLSLCWQLAVEQDLRRLVFDAWKSG